MALVPKPACSLSALPQPRPCAPLPLAAANRVVQKVPVDQRRPRNSGVPQPQLPGVGHIGWQRRLEPAEPEHFSGAKWTARDHAAALAFPAAIAVAATLTLAALTPKAATSQTAPPASPAAQAVAAPAAAVAAPAASAAGAAALTAGAAATSAASQASYPFWQAAAASNGQRGRGARRWADGWLPQGGV